MTAQPAHIGAVQAMHLDVHRAGFMDRGNDLVRPQYRHERPDRSGIEAPDTGIERAQLAAYLDALPTLSQPKIRAAAAAILANDAQHVSVLRASMGLAPLPSPFVTGRE